VSVYRRRIFWGHSLAQALARASRYHGLPVDRLAYRIHEKRHGFVKHPRAVLVEVDPERPELPVRAISPATPPPSAAPPRPSTAVAAERRPAARPRREEAPPPREVESWDVPDEESIYAAAEAARRLLQLVALMLDPRVSAAGERLEVVLEGVDEPRLVELGVGFLDTLENLMPRAVMGLSGRHVRCRVDGAGLRARRESELQALAREVAERVRRSGERELLGPFNPAERRIVHLELREVVGVRTESLGHGFLKRLAVDPD
jgi:spoIIIJ-associated protein